MAELVERQVIEQDQIGDQSEVVRTTSTEPVQHRRAVNKMIQLVYFITGVILALLGVRFILQLLGASQASGFVDLIYSLTEPLVAPFYGVFQTTIGYGVARLELEALLAMLIYLLVGWGVAQLFRLAK